MVSDATIKYNFDACLFMSLIGNLCLLFAARSLACFKTIVKQSSDTYFILSNLPIMFPIMISKIYEYKLKFSLFQDIEVL